MFCPRTLLIVLQAEIWPRMRNIVLSNNFSPDKFLAQSAFRTAGSRQNQKPLIEGLMPCLLAPAQKATGNKIYLVGVQGLYPKATLWKRGQITIRKTAGIYPVPNKGCLKEQSCWDRSSWVMNEIRDPFCFQFLCLSSLYLLPFSLNP